MMVLFVITSFISFIAGWAFANIVDILLEDYRHTKEKT